MTEAVRVLIVDDSPFVCRLLAQYVRAAPQLAVAGTAHDGESALRLAAAVRPDVIALDLEMPGMNGLEFLRRLMFEQPTPVIVVTGATRRGAQMTQAALGAGAVDYLLKYEPGADLNPTAFRAELTAKLRVAAQVKVIRSLQPQADVVRPGIGLPMPVVDERLKQPRLTQVLPPLWIQPGSGVAEHVIVIGASTGGPIALRELLEEIPEGFPAGVLIVQHLPVSFTGILVNQLAKAISLPVQEAAMGDPLLPGRVFVAPGDWHLLLQPGGILEVVRGTKIRGYRPSIDVTMQSAAHVYGRRTCGVVLTGMGEDGAVGLETIRNNRGRTFAQDGASCVVYGMPRHAVEQGCVEQVGTPREIGHWLARAFVPAPMRAEPALTTLC